jgi:hypothetical protein
MRIEYIKMPLSMQRVEGRNILADFEEAFRSDRVTDLTSGVRLHATYSNEENEAAQPADDPEPRYPLD